MHWFETIMWSWLHFYADILTAAGLIGLYACIVRGIMAFGDWTERTARK